jgi:hypothetical protein
MVIRTVGVKEFASKVAARDQARATTRQGHAQSVLANHKAISPPGVAKREVGWGDFSRKIIDRERLL